MKYYSHVKYILKVQTTDTRYNIKVSEGLIKLIAPHPIYTDGLREFNNYIIIYNIYIELGTKLL